MLTKKHIIPVGGKTKDKEEEKMNDRMKNTLEPVAYHSAPLELYEELLHDFYAKFVVDLTPLDGRFAYAALRNRIGYIGIAYNPEHQRLLEERLLSLLEADMRNSESPLFSASYCEAVGCESNKSKPKLKPNPKPKKPGQEDEQGQAEPKKRPRGKGKAKAKAKTKNNEGEGEEDPQPKKLKTGQEDEEEEEQEDEEVWDPLGD